MLKRVSIQNFKSLKDVTLDLQKVNLLIGPNNSGKTNFLKALEFFYQSLLTTNRIDTEDYLRRLRFNLSDSDPVVECILSGNEAYRVKTENGKLKSLSRGFDWELYNWVDHAKSISHEEVKKRLYAIQNLFSGLVIYRVDSNKITKPGPVGQEDEITNADASNLVNFLDLMLGKYRRTTFNQIEQDLEKCIPEFNEINLDNVTATDELKKLYGDGKAFKRLGLTNSKQDITYWADELSEGTLYFLALLCIINQPNPPKLLLLEEPEKGIHPRRIREVMDFIFRLAEEKDIQIILTTHNEHVLDDFATRPESVFVFDKDEEGATYVRNLQTDIIEPTNKHNEELGLDPIDLTTNLSENWLYGLLGGVSANRMSKPLRYTLIGEGFAEYEFIPAYMAWIGKTQTPQLQINRTNVQIPISKNPSVSKVLQEAGTMCARSFTDDRDPCDLCIIGIDLDKPDHTDDLEYHTERLRELRESMGKVHRVYKDNIILYVPIQAIDCWISYVQQNATANSLESSTKDETKKRVYGQSNPDRQRIKKVVQEAVVKADFTRLAKQSRSFAHFHKQVLAFLTEHTKA